MPELNLQINENDLASECLKHPAQVGEWGAYSVKKQEEYDRAKAKFDLVKAQLDIQIRANPAGFGIPKLTEVTVSSAMTQSKAYQEAQNEMLTAKRNSNLCVAALQSLEHRRKALDLAVQLYTHNYYAEKITHHGGSEEDKRASRSRGRELHEERKKEESSDD